MRLLPRKRNFKQDLIIKATFDFFGDGLTKKEIPKVRNIALYLMRRKKGIKLDEEQEEAIWYIRQNLKDKTYIQDLLSNPPTTPVK